MFWHSSAHILGEALERLYGGCLCYGPPIEGGFYYDMHVDQGGVSAVDHPSIETLMRNIVKERQPFERLELAKEDLLRMFEVRMHEVLTSFVVCASAYQDALSSVSAQDFIVHCQNNTSVQEKVILLFISVVIFIAYYTLILCICPTGFIKPLCGNP